MIAAGILDILLIEDCASDVLLISRAIAESGVSHRLHTISDGTAALDYLRELKAHLAKLKVGLILLDLDLPGKHGFEVLAAIKGDAGMRHIPVIILTNSSSEKDITWSYDLHANCYVVKPFDINEFDHTIRAILHFWVNIVRLPQGNKK